MRTHPKPRSSIRVSIEAFRTQSYNEKPWPDGRPGLSLIGPCPRERTQRNTHGRQAECSAGVNDDRRYFTGLRRSLCSSNRFRLDSSSQSIFWAFQVFTRSALKRIMRPFCRCTRHRASAMCSSIRRRSSSKPMAFFEPRASMRCPIDA